MSFMSGLNAPLLAAALVVVGSVAEQAQAQSAADQARARAQYEQGLRELYAGNAEAALNHANTARDLPGADNARLAALRVEAHLGLRDWDAAEATADEFFTLNPTPELTQHIANLTVIIDEAQQEPSRELDILWVEADPTEQGPSEPGLGETRITELTLAQGFSPSPHRIEVVSGGTNRLRDITRRGCSGWADIEPDLTLTYEQATGEGRLHIYIAEADGDMTLAVETPEGEFRCNDDQSGLAPGVRIRDARPGVYRIWVGSYGGSNGRAQRYSGVLLVSETGFDR